jgi:hypothetical protein
MFDRYDINKSIYGHPFRITTDIYKKISVPGANLGSGVVTGTDAQYLLAQEIAIKAYKEGQRLLTNNLHREFAITTNVTDATIKINGTEQSSVWVPQGATVDWEVSKFGYYTQSGSEVVNSDITKYVELLPLEVETLTAVFTQGKRTIFNEQPLDDLRKYLVVTANYIDGTTIMPEDYTLSGELTGGTSTVTVAFGNQTTTFDVEVTEIVIPEGYTRYGWIATKKDSNPGNKVPSNFIYLLAYEDMNKLSAEFILGEKPGVTRAGCGVCGARLSMDSGSWYGLYIKETCVNVDLRGGTGKIDHPKDLSKFRLVIDNPPTSPCSASINNGETFMSREWTNSPVINCGMSLFNNIPNGTNDNMSLNFSTLIGEIIFRDYDGVCVGYYIPVTYNGKIGMYDLISGKFYTAKTASAVTVGNSGCLYKVGNW